MSVHTTDRGVQISLPDKMCLDRHVADCLQCLECWLSRCLGDPRASGRPWRLQRLDLSRNELCDASIMQVCATLKQLDIRIECLWLGGNKFEAKGLEAITEYVWNCPDPLHELDISDNEVYADPGGGGSSKAVVGGDVVSALLRCFYNHSCYPRSVAVPGTTATQAVPLQLKIGGNLVQHPKKLLKEIQAKGGKEHVRICSGMEAYTPVGKEYLAICAPDFQKQRKREEQQPNGASVAAEAAAPLPVAAPPATAERKRSRSRRKKTERRRRGAELAPQVAQQVPAVPAAPAAAVASAPQAVNGASAGIVELADWIMPAGISEEDFGAQLQKEVHERLGAIDGLPPEQSTRDMLSEFTVCMVVARKGRDEIERELQTFLGSEARTLTDWLSALLQSRYGKPGSTRVARRRAVDDADAFQ